MWKGWSADYTCQSRYRQVLQIGYALWYFVTQTSCAIIAALWQLASRSLAATHFAERINYGNQRSAASERRMSRLSNAL